MLMIDKSENGIVISISGDEVSILAELGVLVETVQEKIGKKADVYSLLNDPLGKCLTRGFLREMKKQ